VPSILDAADNFTDLKIAFILLDETVAADLQDAGQLRLRFRRKRTPRWHQPFLGMLDPVAVEAQDNALRDLPLNGVKSEAASDHIRNVELLLLPVEVMKGEGTEIGKAARQATGGRLVIPHPRSDGGPPFRFTRLLAPIAMLPIVHLASHDSGNRKGLVRLLRQTAVAQLHGLPSALRVARVVVGGSKKGEPPPLS
jgi:hypothetical protein